VALDGGHSVHIPEEVHAVAEAPREMLERLSHALVPSVGDCASLVLVDERGSVRDCFGAHRDPGKQAVARELGSLVEEKQTPFRAAWQSGEPSIVKDLPERRRSHWTRLLSRNGIRSAACAPLRAPGSAGLLTVFSTEPVHYDHEDLLLLRELGHCAERILDPAGDPRSSAEHLLKDVRHDLGNPLAAVRLNLQYLLSALGRAEPLGARQIEQALQAVGRMEELLDELGDLFPMRGTQTAGQTSIATAVGDVMDVLSPLANQKSIRLYGNVFHGGKVAIPGPQLFRVLSNLVGNAIKYTQTGGRILVSTSLANDRVTIVVQDNGPGMTAEATRHIFDPSWLAESPVRRGSGLGLAIVKRIVDAHRGSISVVSRPRSGTAFFVRLPRA
jgi:signal transduction histidine kinase